MFLRQMTKVNVNLKCRTDRRLKQSPVVLLKDCLMDRNAWNEIHSFGKRKKFESEENLSADLEATGFLKESMDGLLTPSESSLCGDSKEGSSLGSVKRKAKRRRSKTVEEYEVEKVVCYRLDENRKMWYRLKWKGWKSKYNTYQTIEDMENCNKLLMEYFECGKPNSEEFARMDREVEESVLKSDVYDTLIRTNFKKSEFLKHISFSSIDLNLIFTDNFKSTHRRLETEYEWIIRCLIGMCDDRDRGMFSRAEKYKIALKICKLRENQLKVLKQQEDKINLLENCLVRVINDKDLDVLPDGLEYLTELKPGNGVRIPKDPLVGCNCPDGCSPKSKCCGRMMEAGFVYTKFSKLKCFRVPIYECNIRCKCPPDCPNRVVQRGRTIPVAIFKTEHCGWGVKTLQNIQKGSFVSEYFGEVISENESVVRDVEYFSKSMSYIFDLDFTPDRETKFCIDATRGGNFSRYINHSCDPNLIVCTVWINCLDPYMPQLAFFARRNIRKGEELSIDYESRVDSPLTEIEAETSAAIPRTISNKRCYCNKPKCRQWLFGSL